jgi:hypothetical protein
LNPTIHRHRHRAFESDQKGEKAETESFDTLSVRDNEIPPIPEA